MSMNSYSINGFGACVTKIAKSANAERIAALIEMAPELKAELLKTYGVERIEDLKTDDIRDYASERTNIGTSTGIIALAISRAENIGMLATTDYNDDEYIIFCARYPWEECTEEEKALTPEKLQDILWKYLSVISDKRPDVDYCNVEQFG